MAVRLVVRHPSSAAGEAGDLRFEFEQARIVIGRSPGADVRLPDAAVSETHATLERRGDHYLLRDERSLNGTAVNGAPLVPERARVLAEGDQIEICDFALRFSHTTLVHATSPERTASLARRMLRELLGREHEANAAPRLRVDAGPDRGVLISLEGVTRLLVGRGADAQVRLRDARMAPVHVLLESDADGTIACDATGHGLEVNGKLVRERRLRHGDVLALGESRIVYEDAAENALRALERAPVHTHTRTLPQGEKPPAAPPAEGASGASAADSPSQVEAEALAAEPPLRSSPLDYLVYALASVILAASITGLIWLLK